MLDPLKKKFDEAGLSVYVHEDFDCTGLPNLEKQIIGAKLGVVIFLADDMKTSRMCAIAELHLPTRAPTRRPTPPLPTPAPPLYGQVRVLQHESMLRPNRAARCVCRRFRGGTTARGSKTETCLCDSRAAFSRPAGAPAPRATRAGETKGEGGLHAYPTRAGLRGKARSASTMDHCEAEIYMSQLWPV